MLTLPAFSVFHFIGKIEFSKDCSFVILVIVVVSVTQAKVHDVGRGFYSLIDAAIKPIAKLIERTKH